MLILSAPIDGWAEPLSTVPDPVFASGMMGDGIAVDPLGTRLCAPCDGVVLAVHAAAHAVTLRGEGGVELLIHVGIDTVALGGVGLDPRVAPGDRVTRGQTLIAIDLDALALAARALVTPIVVTNGDRFRIAGHRAAGRVAMGDPLFTVMAADAAATALPKATETARRSLRVALPHGIHARPAARIAALARRQGGTVRIVAGDRAAAADSVTAILSLGIGHGDTIAITAAGAEAEQAVRAVAALIERDLADEPEPVAHADNSAPRPADTPGTIPGVSAAPGLAIGPAWRLRIADPVLPVDGRGVAIEQARLAAALDAARAAIAARGGLIADAHLALLDDPALRGAAGQAIAAGRDAGHGWRTACRAVADTLRSRSDARIAERADDLLDCERQVIAALLGTDAALPAPPPGSILIAEDLLPSQVAGLGSGVAGLVSARGGPTSHAAILAAGAGLPMLVAVGDPLGRVADGAVLVLDADAGTLRVDPPETALAEARERIAARIRTRDAAAAMAGAPARTRDGTRIEVFANCGSLDDARLAVAMGAEGCGLLRTEFLFLDRTEPPSSAEQQDRYQAIADTLAGRPLVIRLLDIGGDKPAPYLALPVEDNPALGLRGIRVGLAMPDLLDAQLRAILSVRPAGQARILLPMVASLAEIRAVRLRVDALCQSLGVTGRVPIGIMVETPAAAVTAATLAQEADFLSIGSNDLTQYALAMDRGNPAVALGVDALHPAVLTLIASSVSGGAVLGRWTGLCGGLASDPLAVPILIGLGVTELSAQPRFVPELKALVARIDRPRAQDHARAVLALDSADAVRAAARRFAGNLP